MLESETKIFRVFDIFLWRGGRKCGGGQCVNTQSILFHYKYTDF